ncbi:hypothetical protein EDD16DRAFT_1516824 [Pisolithus croceorrhizus]|nr:hypothetical protein EDD16DRAFT_1516824 [Pisolithus croceorrhizus]
MAVAYSSALSAGHASKDSVDAATGAPNSDPQWLHASDPPLPTTVIKATAAVAGVELEEPAYKHYQDNKMPEFPAKFSCGRIPAFEGAEGFNLMEGAAIARYSTYHSRIRDSSEIAGWMEENISIVIPVKIRCRQKVVFLTLPSLSLKMRPLAGSQLHGFSTPEATLLTHTYLVNERLTLAYIAVTCVIFLFASYTPDAPLHNRYPNVLCHLDLIINQPKLKDVFGQPTFVEKAVQYIPPAEEKGEKEPKQPAPVPTPKKEKPKKAEEDDEEDENPNPKTPLISYQNRHSVLRTGNALIRTRTCAGPVALKCFCEKRFLNLYRVYFKYNEEVTIVFMSSSQISGFFNCLEASRITTKKLDMENTEDKAFFEGALTWDLEIDNQKRQDGKKMLNGEVDAPNEGSTPHQAPNVRVHSMIVMQVLQVIVKSSSGTLDSGTTLVPGEFTPAVGCLFPWFPSDS